MRRRASAAARKRGPPGGVITGRVAMRDRRAPASGGGRGSRRAASDRVSFGSPLPARGEGQGEGHPTFPARATRRGAGWACRFPQEATRDAPGASPGGAVYLIPSSLRTGEIARILREGYDVSRLNDGFRELQQALALDYLFIDTHPGVNEETLLSIAISDALLVVLRADHQDYQGTAVTVDLARRLETPHIMLLVNKVLPPYDEAAVRAQMESTYNVPVAGVLPLSSDVVRLASAGVFALAHPQHAVTDVLRDVARRIA